LPLSLLNQRQGGINVPTLVYGFADWEEKENHFLDHRHEFGDTFSSADEYEAAAIAFLMAPLTGTVLQCVRRNGDALRFDPSTDEFAICDRAGYLKTYYKPDPSWHEQASNLIYFRGQCAK
jgi:filamentous hemagglutinin